MEIIGKVINQRYQILQQLGEESGFNIQIEIPLKG